MVTSPPVNSLHIDYRRGCESVDNDHLRFQSLTGETIDVRINAEGKTVRAMRQGEVAWEFENPYSSEAKIASISPLPTKGLEISALLEASRPELKDAYRSAAIIIDPATGKPDYSSCPF